jgi:hypothetical protein
MPERLQQQSQKKETLRVTQSGGLRPVLQEAMCHVWDQVKRRRGFSFLHTLYYNNHSKANSATAYGVNNKSKVQSSSMPWTE